MARKLYTIGYEGRNLGEFVETLRGAHVKTLLDVRKTAWSHKPGFSKTALRLAVENAGINYAHAPQVGAPKELRTRLYSDGDYPAFFEGYGEHLNGLNGGLTDAASVALAGGSCLLCFEAEPAKCHRSALAARFRQISGNDLEVIHL
ncbi:MAG: DUF488 domain-containing protein [Candidatus Micrarchaeia archaeon]